MLATHIRCIDCWLPFARGAVLKICLNSVDSNDYTDMKVIKTIEVKVLVIIDKYN